MSTSKYNSLTKADDPDQNADAAGWSYAPPAGGIVNSTADVAAKAAAGVGLRNYITGCQISADALGALTEFVIKDGATVLARVRIQTSGIPVPVPIRFNPPLRGSANTAVNIATTIASVTGGVVADLQGFVGAV